MFNCPFGSTRSFRIRITRVDRPFCWSASSPVVSISSSKLVPPTRSIPPLSFSLGGHKTSSESTTMPITRSHFIIRFGSFIRIFL